jgi:hypothetical protein
MKTKLQKLVDTRRRLDKKQSELDKLRREEYKRSMEAIFEVLGRRTVVPLNATSHHSGGVSISYSDGFPSKPSGFMVENKVAGVNGIKLALFVKDESNEHLATFKKLMEVSNAKEN